MRGPSSTSSHGCFFPVPPTCASQLLVPTCAVAAWAPNIHFNKSFAALYTVFARRAVLFLVCSTAD